MSAGDSFYCVDIEWVRDQRKGWNQVPFLIKSKFGESGTVATTEVRMSQSMFSRVETRSAGRDRALSFTSSQLHPLRGGIRIGQGGRVFAKAKAVPKVMPKGKAKAVPKPMVKAKVKAKAVPKVKAMAKAGAMK